MLVSFSSYSIPKLSSYTSTGATIYLDFDGEYVTSPLWNGGTAFTCTAPPLTDAKITEVFNRVSEDYRPFDINITTDEDVFLAAPIAKRIRVIVTTTSAWYTGVGGVGYVGSFTWGDDTPCFVFSDRLGNSAKYVAECCSHESGHTLGLAHQSSYDNSCALTATYNEGVGTGQSSWAPIMGNSYYRNMSGWNNGPTPYGCSNVQDNLTIITTKNGFTYRADDFTDDVNTASLLDATEINVDGIISTNSDKDAFSFELAEGSNILIDANPYSVGINNDGADLDLKVSLYDKDKQLLRVYNPDNSMSVSIDTILTQGKYYMIVDGTGNKYATDYGSLGSYVLKGLAKILPIRSVVLNARQDNNKHNLSWNIITDNTIKSVVVELSGDGIHFNSLNIVDGTFSKFSYTPFKTGNIFYRLKVISVLGQVAYSNTVSLSNTSINNKSFTVSTFTNTMITVNAAENFRYVLSDVNGNLIAKGNGVQGYNKVDVSRQAGGMYILQLLGNSTKQTERIIKQ